MNTDTWETESATLVDLFHRLGNPSDAAFVAQVTWLVDHGHLPLNRVLDAANGPKMIGGVRNPVAYFRTSLVDAIGKAGLDAALAKLPRRKWLSELPGPSEYAARLAAACGGAEL
jgi:hypothetical protein